jgi:crotonobetainyl-CoA:carnitine CoA-transferase CaiB-like acyl-CoA transferase
MRSTAPHLPGFAELDIDTGRGKLSAALDLRAAEERDRLTSLLRSSHIFVQGYRPGGLAALGFSPEACAELRPGIIAVTLSAYGHEGPWAGRRGFDSLVQNAMALARKAHEGGSWHVRVSLAQTGHWLAQLARLTGGVAHPDSSLADIADLLETTDTPFGRLTCVRHAAQLSETPAHWLRPPVPLGSHAPVWPE